MQLLWSNMYPQSELDNYKLQVDLLQEKLKQSEENRQQLQQELQQILQRRSEHDKSVRAKLRQKYQSFLDEQEQRNERNQVLVQMLERIDQQSTALSARSERLKMMKHQYDRYFAKLMQTQPVRCMQNAAMNIGGPTATQIPVLLPAVAAQPPAAAQAATTTGVAEQTSDANATAPSMQLTAAQMEAITAVQPAALTPRMWTFAMATPTPAGLLLTGAPTAQLQSTATPFELLQYPLGYGSLLQQQLQQQQQMQLAYVAAQPPIGTAAFGSRGNVPQNYNAELSEKAPSGLNKYETRATSKRIETHDNAVLSTPADEASAGSKELLGTQDCAQRSANIEAGSKEVHHIEATPVTTHATPSQQSATLPLEQQLEHQTARISLKKPTEPTVANVLTRPSELVKGLNKNMSEVSLEDANSPEQEYAPYTDWRDNINEPKSSAPASENFTESVSAPRRPLLKSAGSWQRRSAEEHKQKLGEIEQKYGIAEEGANTEPTDMDNNITLSTYRPFSEIVNSQSNKTSAELPMASGNTDNQSWQSHSGSMEYAPKATSSSAPSVPKQVASIDNIENAIYGELVNPQINDIKPPTLRTAAQGFFTELLGQQDMPNVSNTNQQQHSIKESAETSNSASGVDNSAPGYANYSTSIDGNEPLEASAEKFTGEAANSNRNEPQNQTTYDSTNNEFYQQSADSTAAATNSYAEYPTDPTTDPNAASSSANQQLQQEQQQQEYAQQGYENYDAAQYSNYDPNAYPGYIYDETTGQYIVDPQYVAAEGSAAEAAYAAQDYSEQQLQEQLSYPSSQEQEANYAYEDNTYATAAPTTADAVDASATPTTAEVANVSVPAPAPESEPTPAPNEPPVISAPKVLKPTSILTTAEKHAAQNEAQKKKKRVNFVDSSETDESSSAKLPAPGAVGNESDFDFSSGAETSVG